MTSLTVAVTIRLHLHYKTKSVHNTKSVHTGARALGALSTSYAVYSNTNVCPLYSNTRECGTGLGCQYTAALATSQQQPL
jgi:hypothetical protein